MQSLGNTLYMYGGLSHGSFQPLPGPQQMVFSSQSGSRVVGLPGFAPVYILPLAKNAEQGRDPLDTNSGSSLDGREVRETSPQESLASVCDESDSDDEASQLTSRFGKISSSRSAGDVADPYPTVTGHSYMDPGPKLSPMEELIAAKLANEQPLSPEQMEYMGELHINDFNSLLTKLSSHKSKQTALIMRREERNRRATRDSRDRKRKQDYLQGLEDSAKKLEQVNRGLEETVQDLNQKLKQAQETIARLEQEKAMGSAVKGSSGQFEGISYPMGTVFLQAPWFRGALPSLTVQASTKVLST